MDSLKKLQLEYGGIRNTIIKYTSKGNIINFLDGLKQQIELGDMEAIIYYMDEICKWYESNIEQIHSNEFVIDYSDHDRNKEKLQELYKELINNKSHMKVVNKGVCEYSKIFLSHNSYDKKYGDALRNLFNNIGLKKEQLIYTSHALHKIPTGNNIFEYLKSNISSDIFVIFLWSNKYLESAACLNEMGAAWISESDYVNIYTPDFDFNNPQYHNCVVDTRSMGIILKDNEECKIGMTELKDKLVKNFGLVVDEKDWVYQLDEFIKEI
ncbi:MAG: toll/interleukin-1 receptor domain-containing protein [Clostridium sp.]|nr:toll/interleukin-1 receptor domain-containing protein [Clostridium sp.]